MFCSFLYGQRDGISWHLSGQTRDESIKAYFVSDNNTACRNVLVFKKEKTWDTLNLCKDASMLPLFKDTCRLQSMQMDGQGLHEIILSWDYEFIGKNEIQRYTFYTIWDLDTREQIFYMTPNYQRWNKEIILGVDEFYNIIDSTITLDSCVYTCNFEINSIGQIVISNLTQEGHCNDNGLWKIEKEGVWCYEDKKLHWKKNNDG